MAVDLIEPTSQEQKDLLTRLGVKAERNERMRTKRQASRLIAKTLDFKKRGAAALSAKWLGKYKRGGGDGGAAGASAPAAA